MCTSAILAENWTTYMHDSKRHGISKESLKSPLYLQWVHKAKQKPSPAWPAPARQDYLHSIFKLTPTTIYDRVFHTTIANGLLYYASSSENTVYCLNANNGNLIWKFSIDAPIRLSPLFYNNKIYFGADNGFLYSLNAKTGKKNWKYFAGPKENRLLPGNGKLISRWPIRAGIARYENTIYFSAGLFPKEGVYNCAINAETGKEIYKTKMKSPAQGYISVNKDIVSIPTGRTIPTSLDRNTGRYKHYASINCWTGGAGYVIEAEGIIITGNDEKGRIAILSAETKKSIAKINAFKVILDNGVLYVNEGNSLIAIDKKTYINANLKINKINETPPKKQTLKDKDELAEAKQSLIASNLWRRELKGIKTIILSKNKLYLGGVESIFILDKKTGKLENEQDVNGVVYGLAISDKKLFASTTEGYIYCFGENKTKLPIKKKKEINIIKKTIIKKNRRYNESLLEAWELNSNSFKKGLFTGKKGTVITPRKNITQKEFDFINLKGNSFAITENVNSKLLPKQNISIEVVCKLNKHEKWRNLIGAIQDNGNYERGWALGYKGDKIYFALSSEKVKRLTYLQSKTPLQMNYLAPRLFA